MGDLVVLQKRQHNAGAVHYAHALGLFLGTHHNHGRQDADGREQDRSQESNEEEALFLNLVKILALDNDA